MNTNITIIGGGISGLHTAYQLQRRGIDFVLLEARDRLGGRILSHNYHSGENSKTSLTNEKNLYDAKLAAFDVGPSWFWSNQKNIETLLNELDLNDSVFSQQSTGQSLYEDQQGNIQKGFYGITMEGAYRLDGGIRQIIAALKDRIDRDKVYKSSHVKTIEYKTKEIISTFNNDTSDSPLKINSKKVVIALPPRIAMSAIEFQPTLPELRINELNSYGTWMAGHAKFIAVYDEPFWIDQELSGDAISHIGPLREIHDASSRSDNYRDDDNKQGFALFGFAGIPGSYRKGNEDQICTAAIDQLVRLFGDQAATPVNVVLQDWAQEAFTATEVDQSMSGGHANSSITNYTEPSFGNRLIWSGSETADHRRGFNGLLEGALEASIRSVDLLL